MAMATTYSTRTCTTHGPGQELEHRSRIWATGTNHCHRSTDHDQNILQATIESTTLEIQIHIPHSFASHIMSNPSLHLKASVLITRSRLWRVRTVGKSNLPGRQGFRRNRIGIIEARGPVPKLNTLFVVENDGRYGWRRGVVELDGRGGLRQRVFELEARTVVKFYRYGTRLYRRHCDGVVKLQCGAVVELDAARLVSKDFGGVGVCFVLLSGNLSYVRDCSWESEGFWVGVYQEVPRG